MSLRQQCAAVVIGLVTLAAPGSLLRAQVPQPGAAPGAGDQSIDRRRGGGQAA